MTQLRQRMLSDLQLKGMSERSQQIYIRQVRMLAEYYEKSPDLLTIDDIRNYFLHLKNVKNYSRTALKISYYGLRFFYTVTLNWDLNSFPFLQTARRGEEAACCSQQKRSQKDIKFNQTTMLSNLLDCDLYLRTSPTGSN